MNDATIFLAPGPDRSVVLYGCPRAAAPAVVDPAQIPAAARRMAIVVDGDAETAPAVSQPLTVRRYRDGTWCVSPRRESM